MKLNRVMEQGREKGSGAWLNALPLLSVGYTLNKQEFRDSVCLRYGDLRKSGRWGMTLLEMSVYW